MNTDDQELIDACLNGQTEAFDQLVLRYQDRLYNTLAHVLGSADDARDVAQETFVLAFQKLKTFNGRSAFYTWLFRIALNAGATQKRKASRTAGALSLESARDQQGFELVDSREDGQPGHALETSERQARVWRALGQLGEDYRSVLVLKEIDGLRYDEIAEVLDCPVGTVRSRIHRARNELREKLRDLLVEESQQP